jgi:hypothetical protein
MQIKSFYDFLKLKMSENEEKENGIKLEEKI